LGKIQILDRRIQMKKRSKKPIDINAAAAHKYRLLQAQRLIDEYYGPTKGKGTKTTPTEPQGRPEILRYLCSNEFRVALKQSELIVGQDEATGNEFVVFGRPILERISETGAEEKHVVLMVPILQETEELECLIAAVQVVKGWHEYEPSIPE
jgi:hypothetical protein